MDYPFKEVDFRKYCKLCKYRDVDDVKDPCNDCLGEPTNLNSCKPVYYEEDEKALKQQEKTNVKKDTKDTE